MNLLSVIFSRVSKLSWRLLRIEFPFFGFKIVKYAVEVHSHRPWRLALFYAVDTLALGKRGNTFGAGQTAIQSELIESCTFIASFLRVYSHLFLKNDWVLFYTEFLMTDSAEKPQYDLMKTRRVRIGNKYDDLLHFHVHYLFLKCSDNSLHLFLSLNWFIDRVFQCSLSEQCFGALVVVWFPDAWFLGNREAISSSVWKTHTAEQRC